MRSLNVPCSFHRLFLFFDLVLEQVRFSLQKHKPLEIHESESAALWLQNASAHGEHILHGG